MVISIVYPSPSIISPHPFSVNWKDAAYDTLVADKAAKNNLCFHGSSVPIISNKMDLCCAMRSGGHSQKGKVTKPAVSLRKQDNRLHPYPTTTICHSIKPDIILNADG